MLLTVIMPLYNEESTADEIIKRVLDLNIDLELIIVNNGSTDATSEIIHKYDDNPLVTVLDKEKNIGKGDAIKTAVPFAKGKYIVIQDGDLEYDPKDIEKMVALAEEKDALAVFGSRELNPRSGISYGRYLWGGRLLTFLANLLYRVNITDESTCYKMLRTDLMKAMRLESEKFEFCPEVVGKLGRNKIKIYEIPAKYNPRKFEEGKKIRWIDGVEAIWTLLKYRLQPRSKIRIEIEDKNQNDSE